MQAAESQTVILYYSDLRGEWPQAAARSLAGALPYARRLQLASGAAHARASLAGIALALRALEALGVAARPGALHFPQWGKPALRGPTAQAADFSVSHSGDWVACAALRGGRIGLDIECATGARARDWVLREAALKCLGHPLARAPTVGIEGRAVRVGAIRLHTRRIALAPGLEAALAATGAMQPSAPQCVPLGALLDPWARAA